MLRQFKLDEKNVIPIATFLLFGIGAIKVLLFGDQYHLAVYNFTSFSNILEYTFDISRGLLYSAIPIVAFIIFQHELIPFLKRRNVVCISFTLLCISALCFWYCYKKITMTYPANFWLKYLLEAGIFFAGVWLKSCKWVGNFEIVKLALLVSFLYLYLQIENKFLTHVIDDGKSKVSKIILKTHANTNDTIFTNRQQYMILNSSDFVFLYNDTTQSITAIPMASILSFTTDTTHKSPK
jgi:hypothetical protein